MRTYSKCTVALLALAVSASMALAPTAFGQDAAMPPPPSAAMPLPPPPAAPGRNRMQRPMGSHNWQGSRGHWRSERWNGRHRRGFMLARLVSRPAFRQRLGITPAQAQKIRTETLQFRESQIRNRADVEVKKLELRALLSGQNPDRAAINQKLQQISTARLTQTEASINFHLDMRAALTSQQQQKLRQMSEDFFRHRGFHQRGPNGPGGPNHSPGANG